MCLNELYTVSTGSRVCNMLVVSCLVARGNYTSPMLLPFNNNIEFSSLFTHAWYA